MTTETKTGRPPLPKSRAKALDVVAHRATCAYCAWVGPDRPIREPNDADEREHLAVCPKNPARAVEGALSALHAEHQRVRDALAKTLGHSDSDDFTPQREIEVIDQQLREAEGMRTALAKVLRLYVEDDECKYGLGGQCDPNESKCRYCEGRDVLAQEDMT